MTKFTSFPGLLRKHLLGENVVHKNKLKDDLIVEIKVDRGFCVVIVNVETFSGKRWTEGVHKGKLSESHGNYKQELNGDSRTQVYGI